MNGKPPCHLQGLGVLVTRPAAQAERLGEAIEAAHGRPILFPCVEIAGPADPAAVQAQLQRAGDCQLLLFVSANAVDYAFALLPDTLPASQQIAAIGDATAARLAHYGLDATLVPQRFDSEGLLALPELADMSGQRVLILRGNGGRELLADTLRARGATVDYAEVYQRLLPQRSATNLVAGWERWIDAVTVTSAEILDNLITLLGEAGTTKLQQTPLVVVSERLAEHARQCGCRKLYLAANAGDDAVLRALCELA
jgi:uroporphyrinogen-III synthase